METIIFVICLISYRYLLFFVKKSLNRYGNWLWGFAIITTMIVCAIPIILLKKDIISSSVINILIAGFSFFYLPFVLGRMSKNTEHENTTE